MDAQPANQSGVPRLAPVPAVKARRSRWPWHYLISAGLAVAAGIVWNWDRWWIQPERIQALPGDLRKCIDLSEVFAHGFGVLLVVGILAALVPASRRALPRVLACAFYPALVVQLLKVQFGRSRPIRYFDEFSVAHFPPAGETWLGWRPWGQWNLEYALQSFPSGHSATAWGLAIGLAWLYPRGRWLFYGVAVLASMQRIIAYSHWPSDVLVGAAIAFCLAGSLTENWGAGYLLGRWERRGGFRGLDADPCEEAGSVVAAPRRCA